ncbi:MAG: hypothetical protein MI748_19640 [Opitutales bacterium]|nr:hypothetical protein [Opitutales bacterium]
MNTDPIQSRGGVPVVHFNGVDYLFELYGETEKQTLKPTSVVLCEDVIIWELEGGVRCEQIINKVASYEDELAFEWKLKVTSGDASTLLLFFEIAFISDKQPYFQIPGTLYGDHTLAVSRSIQPQLIYRKKGNYPKTNKLRTRADRSTHNSVLSQGSKNVVAIQIDEVTDVDSDKDGFVENGLCIDVSGKDSCDRIGVSMGYQHFPKLYRGKLGDASTSVGPTGKAIQLKVNEAVEASGHLYFRKKTDSFSHLNAVRFFYKKLHQHPCNKVERNDAIRLMAKAIAEDAYREDHKYFPTVLSGDRPDTGLGGDVAWTGGMQVVYPLARSYKHYPKASEIVVDFVENLITHGVNSAAGLFYESKILDEWSTTAWWTELIHKHHSDIMDERGAHSAYVNGQAACYLLKLVEFFRANPDAGVEAERLNLWVKTALSIIDHALNEQRQDGAYGIYYHVEDGHAIHWEGCQGLWFLAAAAEAYKYTDNEKYLRSFEKADGYYFQFLKNGCLWGMPMDTGDAPDEECALPYITGAKTIHEMTGKDLYLERLLQTLEYDFSWKFAYNTRHRNEPLKSLNWSSSGGCITSAHNIHIHQMGNLVAEEIYYAWQQTGDDYVLSRLKDTLNWGLGTFNLSDGHFGFGYEGWATEQFFHSDGVQDDPTRVPNGGIWPDFLSWASACVLLSSNADIPDEFYLPE